MATVTGKTSIKIDELIEGTVVDGYIDGSNQLVLVTAGGAEIITGVVTPVADPSTFPRIYATNSDTLASHGATEGSTGQTNSFVWDVDLTKSQGTDISVGAGTSRVDFSSPGIYTIGWTLHADLDDADAACRIGIRAEVSFLNAASYTAMLSGGDPDLSGATGSLTFYVNPGSSPNVNFFLVWQNLDLSAVTNVVKEITIQKHSI